MESFRTAEGRGRARRPVARLVALGVAAAMAVCLLPGTALAAVPNNIVITPATTTVAQGTVAYFSAEEWNAGVDLGGVTATATWSETDPSASAGCVAGPPGYEACTFYTVGTWTVYAQLAGDTPGSATVTVTSAGVQHFSVHMSAYYDIPSVSSPWPETVGVADTATVCAIDINGATLTSYLGTIRFSSSDLLATLPANYTFVTADAGCHTFSVTFNSTRHQWLKVNDISALAMYGRADVFVFYPNAYEYSPLHTPVRLLDTRTGNGFSGKLSAGTPAGIPIANRGGVPWCATAVTGNLTVTNPTAGWAVYLGPTAMAAPTSSTINFVKGQTVANSLTVELNSTTGYLWATYISTAGNTTDLVFDVTGYYGCFTDLTYFPMAMPARVLDTRANNGYAGKLTANMPVTFPVAGVAGIPLGADAVTGNLTVTNASSGWAVYLGATPQANPSSSTINFAGGTTVANGVTVGLSSSGNLSATFISTPGQTADLVFDATGYYRDSDNGMYYVPIAPVRILDSRVTGPLLYANFPQAIQVTGMDGIPTWAGAVTGNLTVTDETNGWAMYAGPTPQVNPATSNINFVTGQVVANGMTSGLHGAYPWPAGEIGYLNVTYISTAGNTTNAVFDATGYFIYGAILVSPTLSTTHSGTVPVGGILSDSATLSGAVGPTGTITFHLYSDSTCGTPVWSSPAEALTGSSATTLPGGWTSTTAGTYYWQAVYSGDSHNKAATSSCGEATVVTKASPTLNTEANSGNAPTIQLQDTATLSGTFGTPTGTMTFNLYSNSTCTILISFGFPDVETVSSANTPSAKTAAFSSPGSYYWTAAYSGDSNNNAVSSLCGAVNETSTVYPEPIS